MADKVGGDILSLQGSSGSVVDENGETIVSTDTGGGSSYILGPTLIRAIVGGVANGDFAKPPLGAETAISDENPLPYWTWVDSTSSGRITAALVANGSAASGNVLRFTAVGAQTGDKVYLERYVSVLGSQARTLTYQPRSVWSSATSNANLVAFTEAVFVKNDGSTVTGGSASGTANGTAIAGSTYAREVQANPNTNGAVPSDGAFIRLRFGLSFSAAVAGTATADACEVRIDTGSPQLLLTDNAAPETYGYGVIYLNNGVLWIRANETGVSGTNPSIYLSSSSGSIFIDPTGTGTAQVLGSASVTGSLSAASLSTSGNADISGTIGVLGSINVGISDTSTVGDITFKGGNGGSIRAFSASAGNDSLGIYNTSGSGFAPLVADSFFPGGQGSFRLDHDGNFDLNDSLDVTGGITATTTITATGDITGSDVVANGVFYNDQPLTSTLTTNGCRFTLISGSLFRLDRITSSRRFKKDIVDAGAEVLEASRRVHARHYTSTIEHEHEGTRLGFIAEELMDAGLDHAVGLDEQGRPDTLDPVALIAALWKRVEDLEARLSVVEGA